MFRSKFLLVVMMTSIVISATAQQVKTDSLLTSARNHLANLEFSKAFKVLKEVEKADSLNPAAMYLKAEAYLLLGREEYFAYMEKLRRAGESEKTNLLNLKHSLFIGSSDFPWQYQAMKAKYPDNKELSYCDWLFRLGQGDFDLCRKRAAQVSENSLFKAAPYLALYHHAWDRDHGIALQYLDTLESMMGQFSQSKYRQVLTLLAGNQTIAPVQDQIELPFSWCGPGMGFYLLDEKGDSLKIELDTGTGYGLMTVHNLNKGASISGQEVMTIPNGIQYNYMDAPRDLHYKSSDLKQPGYRNFLFGYFDGQFSKADGCSSPFAFSQYALHMDPVGKHVYLRSQENLRQYVRKHRKTLEIIPYQVQNGWIFIPCKVNGHEIRMMIETGSRDVNFNKLSTNALGLSPYKSTIPWNGKDYPVTKVDCTLEIGSIKYEVKGGLISDFVLGNWLYGFGSAGDIGPDFLRNYAFIVDPFNRQFIIEKSPAS